MESRSTTDIVALFSSSRARVLVCFCRFEFIITKPQCSFIAYRIQGTRKTPGAARKQALGGGVFDWPRRTQPRPLSSSFLHHNDNNNSSLPRPPVPSAAAAAAAAAAAPWSRRTVFSAAAAAANGDSSSSSKNSTKKKRPTKVLASDPEEVALRPAAPLAEFSVSGDDADASRFEGDLLVLGLFEEDLVKQEEDKEGGEEPEEDESSSPKKEPKFPLSGPAPPCAFAAAGAAAVDASLAGLLTDLALDSDFAAKAGSSAFLRVPRAIVAANKDGEAKAKYRSVGLVGLGSIKKAAAGDKMWGKSPFVGLGAAVASAAKQHKATSAGIAVFNSEIETAKAAEGIAKGLGTGAYESSRFKHGPGAARVSEATLFFPNVGASSSSSPDKILDGASKGNAVASGILLARYLVEAPPNVCTPRHLARAAEAIASSAPDVFSVKILDKRQCEEMGMGAFLGVSACSALEPQFIHLTYTPPGFVAGRS